MGFLSLFFLPSPLGVYISKKWLNVNVRFHLQFWEESGTEVRVCELCCSAGVKYKCERLAVGLEGFYWRVRGVFHV